MKHSPLQLLRYKVPELSCSSNAAYDPQKPSDGLLDHFSVKVVVTREKTPDNLPGHSWAAEMRISQKLKEGANFPYRFDLIIIGFFLCKDGVPPDAGEERFVRVNGSSMLYGMAREVIRSTTAMGLWGPLLLPTISFYDKDSNQKEPTQPAAKSE